jgi:hypothetical protein
MPTIERVIGWTANLIQIGTFVFTIWVLWRTRRRLKNYLESLGTSQSARPVVMAIGLGGSIEGQVNQYLKANNQSMAIYPYTREGLVSEEQFKQILRDLLQLKQKLTNVGVTEVHLFYRGPVTLAMGIGAILHNWVPIKVYDFKGGTYHPVDLPLAKESLLSLLEKVAFEGEKEVTEKLLI